MSISKNNIKLINSLALKKYRQKYNIFIAEGSKICTHILKSSAFEVQQIYYTQISALIAQIIQRNKIPSSVISISEMNKISQLSTKTDILMLVKMPINKFSSLDLACGRHILLDNVQDPGNVGTLIRSAEWFGCDSVLKTTGSVDFYNPKVIQATMGSFADIPLRETDVKTCQMSKNIIIATDMGGQDMRSLGTLDNFILVISNEGKGISNEIKEAANKIVGITQSQYSSTESLNAAMAGSIILSHICA